MIDHSPTTTLDLDKLLTQVVERSRDVIPFSCGELFLFDPTTQLLAPRVVLNTLPTEALPRLIHLGEGIVGLAAQSRDAVLVNDVNNDDRYIPYIEEIRSQVAVPMIFNETLLGVLNIESVIPDAYQPQHVNIARALADQAALAVHTAQLHELVSVRYDRLADSNAELLLRNEISRLATSDLPIELLLPQMAERLARLIGADACAMTLWDPADQRAKRLATYGIDPADFLSDHRNLSGAQQLTAEIIQTGKTLIVNDAQNLEKVPTTLIEEYKIHALLAMPLIARGRPIGATFLMNLRGKRQYTQSDADSIAAILDQIALSIDNHRLLQDTQARLNETSVLLEIAAIAGSSLELNDMLRQVLKLSKQMLGITCGAFLLYDRHTNTLVPRRDVWFGFPPDTNLANIRFPVTDPRSHVAIVFTSGSPYFTNDIQKATHDSYTDAIIEAGLRNLMLAPLRVQDEPMGVFMVGNKHSEFVRQDASLLMAMGSHVAAALRNADLLEDTRERLRETEALQRIAAITSSTLDLDEMLERALQETAELLEVEGAVLLMPNAGFTALVPHLRSEYGIAKTIIPESMSMDSSGHIIHAYHTGKYYVNNDPMTEAQIERRSIITCPLNTRNRTLGTLSLINRKSGDFEESHVELARAIAAQVATSMENAQLFRSERARADLMSLINRIGQDLTATLDLTNLTRKVVQALHDQIGYDIVSVMLLDESGNHLVVQATISSIEGIAMSEGYAYPITEGVTGRVLRTGDAEIIDDIASDPDFFWPPPSPDTPVSGSALVVPLRAGIRPLGAIEAISPQVEHFKESDRLAMQTLATQVSVAIENARLWNQAQRRLLEQGIVHQIGQDLTSILDYNELVNAVVKHMTRALDTALCLLVGYDSDSEQLKIEAEYHAPRSLQPTPPLSFIAQAINATERSVIAQAIETRRQVIIYRDEQGFEAEPISPEYRQKLTDMGIYSQLTLPMIAGDRAVGCVLWIETTYPREFNLSDMRLAQTLTTQAAIAIENARLFRQAQRQAREQALLRRVALGLSTMPDIDTLLNQFAYETQLAFEADNVVASLAEGEDRFIVRASALKTATLAETVLGRLEMGRSLPVVVPALQHGLSVQFSTSAKASEGSAEELNALMEDRPVSLMLAPVIRRGETIGIIEVSCDNPARIFGSHEIQLLEALASQGAIAIDNLSLYLREQRRLHQLEKLQSSGRNIAAQLQIDTLLKTIVNEASKMFETPVVSLMTRNPDEEFYQNRAAIGLSERYLDERKVTYFEYDGQHPRYLAEDAIDLLNDEYQQMLIRKEGIRSILSIPLIKGDQQLGILNLYTKGEARIFTEEEIELFQLFASQAAIAIENASLFQALEERAIELAKANKLKSEFLARVSHELRTPMNSILNFSEMLLLNMYGNLSDKQADRVERISRNGRNLLVIIDDLLDISKIDAGKMQLEIRPVNLRDELESTIYTLEGQASTRGLYLKLEAPSELPPVSADSTRLKQIITNLIGNALKFTKEGGVTVRARVDDYNGVRSVWTSVTDTGIGIKPEDQIIIFDEFRQADGSTTREYGGTGLGLAISKKLVEMMKGNIWVESELTKGSTFTFVLPVYAANPAVNVNAT